MTLLAALNLQPPQALADLVARNLAIDTLRQQLAAEVKRGVKEASVLQSRDAKAELAAALAAAEAMRAAAEKLADPQAKEAAMRAAKERAAAAVAKVVTDRGGARTAPPAAAPAPTAAAAEAHALRPKIEADLLQAKMAYAPLARDAEILAETLKTASGSAKAQAQKRKATVDTQLAAANAAIRQADADLKALDDASSDDAVFHAILARRGSGSAASVVRETDRHDGPLEKSRLSGRQTTTATSLAPGQAVQTTTTQTEGLTKDGFGSKTETTTTTVTGDTRQTTTGASSRSTQLNLDGLTVDGKTTHTREKDGRKTSTETSSSANLGLGGLTTTSGTKSTNADKSSTETKRSSALERNDGKLTAGSTATKTTESASGTKLTNTGTTKAGLVAGKDGLGLTGESEGGLDKAAKSGVKAGLVAGLNASIVCNIVPEPNSAPPMYLVTIKVEIGGKLGASVGFDREDGKHEHGKDKASTGGGSVSLGAKVTMEQTRRLDAMDTQAYVEALKTGNGQQSEFAVIRAVLKQDWGKARELYDAAKGRSTSVADADKRLLAGESDKVGTEKTGGFGLKAGGKGEQGNVGIEAGYERSESSSTTVTKNADGKLTYDTSRGKGSKTTAGANAKMGAAEGGIKLGWTKTSATGVKIVIDPKDPAADALRKELDDCKDEAALEAFARLHPACVQERSRTRGEGESQEVSAGIGGAKGSLKYGNATETTTTTDAAGNLKQKTVTGSSSSGAEFSLGSSLKVAGSSADKVVATSDADGNASADVTKTDTSTNFAKLAEAKLGRLAGQTGQGALTQAAGGADTEDKVVGGIKLTHTDLSNLAALACENWKGWVRACGTGADMPDWVSAGRSIQKAEAKKRAAAAGEALASFVGSSHRDRLEIMKAALGRRAGTVGGGAGFEFKGDLAKLKPDYDAYVVEPSESKVTQAQDAGAKKQAAADVIAKLDALHQAMKNAEFQSPAIRAEMLSTILNRKKRVQAALAEAEGRKDAAPSLNEAKARFNDLMSNCVNFKDEETQLFKRVHALVSGGGHVAAKNQKLVEELKTLRTIWRKDYEEMATLVSKHKLGGPNWSQYRPDDQRFQRCYDNKSPFVELDEQGNEVVDKKTGKVVVAAEAARDQAADRKDRSNELTPEEKKKQEDAAAEANIKKMNDAIKEAKAIQAQIPQLQAQVQALGDKLGKILDKQSKPAAVDLYNKADKLVFAAKEQCNACRRDHVPDLTTLGAAARAKYQQAIGLLQKALAMYPAAK